jgi:hypothetical protein
MTKMYCECKHGCETYAHVMEHDCGCVTVEIYRDSERGQDCTDFSAMRSNCGRLGWAPHGEAADSGRSFSSDEYEAHWEASGESNVGYGSRSYSPGSRRGSTGIIGLVLIGGLVYWGICMFARWDAANICYLNRSRPSSFYCQQAEIPLSQWLLSGSDPMPPGWQRVDGRLRRVSSVQSPMAPPDSRPGARPILASQQPEPAVDARPALAPAISAPPSGTLLAKLKRGGEGYVAFTATYRPDTHQVAVTSLEPPTLPKAFHQVWLVYGTTQPKLLGMVQQLETSLLIVPADVSSSNIEDATLAISDEASADNRSGPEGPTIAFGKFARD